MVYAGNDPTHHDASLHKKVAFVFRCVTVISLKRFENVDFFEKPRVRLALTRRVPPKFDGPARHKSFF